MKCAVFILLALLALLLADAVYASNWDVLGVNLCTGCTPAPTGTPGTTPTPVPTVTPTPAPTPTPGPGTGCTLPNGNTPVDPNINAAACKELQFLYSQEGVGATGHMMQAAQLQFGLYCFGSAGNYGGRTDCQTSWNTQTTADTNNLPLGAVGVDPCSINQVSSGQQVCAFGSGSATDQMAKIAWNAGAIVESHMDATNPIDDWNNAANGGQTAIDCGGQGSTAGATGSIGGWGSIYDCTNNSGESWTQYVTNMITNGTTENSHWNTELNNFGSTWLDLQNSGIPVVLGSFQEYDGSPMWHAENNISPSLLGQLELYDIHYWEGLGIHNIIYMSATNGGAPSVPGGCGTVDMLGWDSYTNLSAGPFTAGQYTNNVNGSNACGKKNIPQGIMEYSTQQGAFDGIDQNANPNMPNLIFASVWSIGTGGRADRQLNKGTANTIDPSWPSLIRDSYTLQTSGVASRR